MKFEFQLSWTKKMYTVIAVSPKKVNTNTKGFLKACKSDKTKIKIINFDFNGRPTSS